jgi:hypothetical protein
MLSTSKCFVSHLEKKKELWLCTTENATTQAPEQNNTVVCCRGHQAAEETSDATLLTIGSITRKDMSGIP